MESDPRTLVLGEAGALWGSQAHSLLANLKELKPREEKSRAKRSII